MRVQFSHSSWTLDTLVEAYKRHQRRTCGLRDQTLLSYERVVRLLVREILGEDPIDPAHLAPRMSLSSSVR